MINNIIAATAVRHWGAPVRQAGFSALGLRSSVVPVLHAGNFVLPAVGSRVGKFVVKLPLVDPARGAWAGISFPGRPCRSGWFAHGFGTPMMHTVWLTVWKDP